VKVLSNGKDLPWANDLGYPKSSLNLLPTSLGQRKYTDPFNLDKNKEYDYGFKVFRIMENFKMK
jgi:hypothetical protein